MAKKQVSFAEKARRGQQKKDNKLVKYVKSVKSEKSGYWRFNESMVELQGNESLDAALKRTADEIHTLDMELPVAEDIAQETEGVEKAADVENEAAVAEKEEKAEAKPEESADEGPEKASAEANEPTAEAEAKPEENAEEESVQTEQKPDSGKTPDSDEETKSE